MRRLLTFALLAFVIACADSTAPQRRTDCWAFIAFHVDGQTWELWAHFSPCPPDSALKATGWTRGRGPR